MSSLATTFIPIPLLQMVGEDKTEITDKNMLNEKDFPPRFLDWFNKHKSDVKSVYDVRPDIQEHFTLKEFALEVRNELVIQRLEAMQAARK